MSQKPPKLASKAGKDKKDEGKAGKDAKDGDDLISILEPSQRADLTILVAACTEGMRKLLLESFSATAGLNPDLLRDGMTDDEKMMSADVNADISAYDKEKKLKSDIEKDLASPKMKALKKNALKAYDEWREQVLMRIGEVVNNKDKAKQQLRRHSDAAEPKPLAPHTSGTVTQSSKKNPKLRFRDLFPPTKTPLTKLPMNKRTLVLHALFLLLISLEHYNAWSRVLMLNLTSSFKLSLKTFEQEEYVLAKGLLEQAKELTADEETKKKQEETKDNRKWRVGVATAAGAAVIGIAGGLAAPLVATGVGSIMGGLGLEATAAAGYLGSVAGSTVVVGSMFGAYGGRMTGQMMDKYAREVEDFEFLPVHSDKKTSEDQKEGAEQASEHDHKLRVTICISGWLTEKEEVVKPWRVLGVGAEVFALKWELEALLNLGHSMDGMLKSAAWGYAQQQLVQQTIFADLMAAFWPIGLLKVARVLDNPFSVAKSRADKAGEVLADALINKAQGERPVTLIGYSLGARVIYTCLMSLAQRKAFGLVENAVLIGAPTPSDTSDWRILRSAVSGRLVNVYSNNDYLLGFMYRTSALQYGVAGLQKVDALAGVENVDVSDDVDGHTRYRFLIGSILKKIGFEDIDMAAVEEERQALEKMIEKEKKESLQSQRNRLLRRESYKGKQTEEQEADHEAATMEKNVEKATQQSMMARVLAWWYAPKTDTKDAEKLADNLQKGLSNPADAKAAVGDTIQDIQASTQTYSQYVVSKLPSMPGRGGTSVQKTAGDASKAVGDPQKAVGNATKAVSDPKKTAGDATKAVSDSSKAVSDAAKNPSKAAGDATKATKGYVASASAYLPTTASLPSLPTFGKGKGSKKTESFKPAQAAEKVTDAGKASADVAQNVATEVVKPTLDNTLNPKDNPAVKAAKDTTKKAPIIHQASDKIPGANKAAQVTSDTVGTTVQNTAQTASGGLNKTASKGADVSSGVASGATNALTGAAGNATDLGSSLAPKKDTAKTETAKKDASKTEAPKKDAPKKDAPKTNGSTYLSRAYGYVPSVPSWGSGKKKPAKLDNKSGASTPSKPELKKTDSGVKSPPKLDRTPSGLKSPPAKLNRTPSGLKSPPTLERLPSGVKSPPAKLERLPSGVKSPAAGAARKLSEAPQQLTKTGSDAAGKATSTGKATAKAGTDAVTKPAETGKAAAKAGTDAVSKAGDTGKATAKAGTDAVSKPAETGKAAAKAGTDAASKAGDTGKATAKAGTDAAGKASETGQQALKTTASAGQGAAKAGTDAVGKGAETGQKALKQGGGYLGSAGSAVTNKLPGFGR